MPYEESNGALAGLKDPARPREEGIDAARRTLQLAGELPAEDQLLEAAEVAKQLKVEVKWVYAN
jgi:hypothetical protein